MRNLWGLVVVLVAACGTDEAPSPHDIVPCTAGAVDDCERECSVNVGRTVAPQRRCVATHPEWGVLDYEASEVSNDGDLLKPDGTPYVGACQVAPDGSLAFYECDSDTICDVANGEC